MGAQARSTTAPLEKDHLRGPIVLSMGPSLVSVGRSRAHLHALPHALGLGYSSYFCRDSSGLCCSSLGKKSAFRSLTIRSSRDRFAARLHGDVYHSAVPRSGPA